jgi:Predicted nucleotide-binding protein containing TIR-like domain
VRALLADDAEVTLWNEGFFAITDTFIESLVNALPRFDFAALLLTPDDLTTSREVSTLGPRDNVLFELGLFMGRLGRSRTFVVRPRGESVRMPSDLAGLTTALYDWNRTDKNYKAAVGPACDSIREVIRNLGFSETKVNTQIRAVQDEQIRQRAIYRPSCGSCWKILSPNTNSRSLGSWPLVSPFRSQSAIASRMS